MTPDLSHPFASGRTAEIYAWADGQILKLYRDWCPAGWADYEANTGRLVCQAGIAAPAVLDVVTVQGRRGIIYERIDGQSMLVKMNRAPWLLPGLARQLAQLHLGIHACRAPSLPRQSANLERSIRAAAVLPEPLKEAALRALAAMPEGDSVCHGDFHPGNVLITAKGPLVIDWMTASAGNPWADMARCALVLSAADIPPGTPARLWIRLGRQVFFRIYRDTYTAAHPGLDCAQLIARWLPITAAARLNEHIPAEEKNLLRLVETLL
jgi:uncharacterized protein (TIGR02172 family)